MLPMAALVGCLLGLVTLASHFGTDLMACRRRVYRRIVGRRAQPLAGADA